LSRDCFVVSSSCVAINYTWYGDDATQDSPVLLHLDFVIIGVRLSALG